MGGENLELPMQGNLFGETWYEKKGKKGRPPFQWTIENANKINMLLAAGWGLERIAGCVLDPRTGLAICVKTLQRHFSPELATRQTARDRLEARRLTRVWALAEAGNIGAERVFADLLARNDRMEVEREMASPGRTRRPEALGKKVVADLLAASADADLMAELDAEVAGNVRH